MRHREPPFALEKSLDLLIFAVGFIDDLKPLGAKFKLAPQLAIAVLAYSLGLRIYILSSPFGEFTFDLGNLSLIVTVLWLVALPDIINQTVTTGPLFSPFAAPVAPR